MNKFQAVIKLTKAHMTLLLSTIGNCFSAVLYFSLSVLIYVLIKKGVIASSLGSL